VKPNTLPFPCPAAVLPLPFLAVALPWAWEGKDLWFHWLRVPKVVFHSASSVIFVLLVFCPEEKKKEEKGEHYLVRYEQCF
jgi:hypothetical protein